MQTLKDVEKQISETSQKLASVTDEDEREELRERMLYLQHKRLDVSAREYAEDVKDDCRFRQW